LRPAAAVVLALVCASPAFADRKAAPADPVEPRHTPAYDQCLASPSGASTLGMIVCTQTELGVQDGRLNSVYRRTMAALNAR
jgi:uncharacterized protein YecT (DUF1311 family)